MYLISRDRRVKLSCGLGKLYGSVRDRILLANAYDDSVAFNEK